VNGWVRSLALRTDQDPMQPLAHSAIGTGPSGQAGGSGAGALAVGIGFCAGGIAANGWPGNAPVGGEADVMLCC
jgi:hypothetical protein